MPRQFEIESLEQRTFLSAGQINFANFSSTTHLIGNGFGADTMIDGNALQLTSDDYHQARSVWNDTAVPISKFRTDFSFRSNKDKLNGDGLTFTLLNGPTSSLGADGRGLGYGNITSPSVSVALNQFNFKHFGSQFGFAVDGERPPTDTDMGSINLHNGHLFRVTVSYDGKVLNVAVADASDKTATFTANKTIDLASVLGTGQAIVGFTAGTGDNISTQDILSWNYSGTDPVVQAPPPVAPTIAAAAASPNPVTGTTTDLSVLGANASQSESGLLYTWRTMDLPAGAKSPTFSDNGVNAAKNTTATFYKDGVYRFRATVTDSNGLIAKSYVTVRVKQTATTIALSPHLKKLRIDHQVDYTATLLDQFNRPMRTQPMFAFSVTQGPGKIDAMTGVYTASETTGHVVIAASADGLTGTVGATVYPNPPKPKPIG